ncbi:DNA phosphorothioation-dependent restriction protein DptG [Cytobacillus gottheilii]|uniref:DNA phosphorothioation-dependent restriction protein DptG n=1 Tax=Cytobacillus gottheilii TaxID=859144 RepID=UPI003CEF46BA
MSVAENRDFLVKLFKDKNGKHDTGQARDILPFLTKRTGAVRNQFNNISGEFTRNICQLKLEESKAKSDEFYLTSEENILSENIASNVDFDNVDDQYDFTRFLDQYLFNGEKINPIHPFLFNYIKVDKKNKNEFGKYAQFMNDVLVKGDENIKKIFNNKESEDILTELILSKMEGLKEDPKSSNNQYEPLILPLSDLYKEDLLYLSKHKEYFLDTFPLLTHFYVFIYACQVVYKFEQFTNSEYNHVQPLYFALDWESISKRRKVADDIEGLKFIKTKAINIFPHIHTISQISHLAYQGKVTGEKDEIIPFVPYSIALENIRAKGDEHADLFLEELNKWIVHYSEYWEITKPTKSATIEEAFETLFHCLKQGVSEGVAEKYGKNIDDLGFNQFIKNRGSLGQVFNIKHDFLLLLTAVSVKDKRIPLNDLFTEFEKRGVAFDRYSKKEIIQVLDRLNIIDKKSDSGDAQYVKPIL